MTQKEYIYTTGEVAKICQVAPRTVSKWFDSGRLKGYRLPGSQDRRVPESDLLQFLKDHEIPIPDLIQVKLNLVTVTKNVPKDSFVFYVDGNNWCCVRPDFISLQESPAGFGLTFKEAYDDFTEKESEHVRRITDSGTSTQTLKADDDNVAGNETGRQCEEAGQASQSS